MMTARVFHRPQSVTSDVEVNEGMAEVELEKLQKQYRIMEGDRKAYSEESRLLISRQKATIERLAKECKHLEEELGLIEGRVSSSQEEGQSFKRSQELQQQAEHYIKGMKVSHKRMQELDEVIQEKEQMIAVQRQKMGGVNAPSMNNSAVQKHIRILENRLDKALVKFNKALAFNKKLRSILDNLRRERVVFEGVYKKLEKDMVEQKRIMAEIIEGSNAAYEARDDAQAKIIALKEKVDKEQQAFVQEMKELNRVLEQDRKLRSFMAIKSSERAGSAAVTEGHSVKKTSKVGDSGTGKDQQDSLSEMVETYEAAFARVRQVTGISDIVSLVETFTNMEDRNFSLFNYVNELNNEIEKIQEEISEVHKRIENLRGADVEEENQLKEHLRSLDLQLQLANEKHEQYEKLFSDLSARLADVRFFVRQIFETIKCDDGSISEHLGSAGVTDVNITQYLGVIEQRSNELLTLDYLLARKAAIMSASSEDGEENDVPAPVNKLSSLLGPGPSAPLGAMIIQTPSTGDDHDVDNDLSEDDLRPLSHEELVARTVKLMNKRERHTTQRSSKTTL